jgi:hypothetical protein
MTNDDMAREMRLLFGKIETEPGNVKAELNDVKKEKYQYLSQSSYL